VFLSNGDAVGVVRAHTADARDMLESSEGVTVLPPIYLPIEQEHADAFGHVNAVVGEMAHAVVMRLHAHHGEPWWHPENTM